MNYERLLWGLKRSQFNELTENWYARLNRLKHAYCDNPSDRLHLLVAEMISRMTVIGSFYINLSKPVFKQGKFKSGGEFARIEKPEQFEEIKSSELMNEVIIKPPFH